MEVDEEIQRQNAIYTKHQNKHLWQEVDQEIEMTGVLHVAHVERVVLHIRQISS